MLAEPSPQEVINARIARLEEATGGLSLEECRGWGKHFIEVYGKEFEGFIRERLRIAFDDDLTDAHLIQAPETISLADLLGQVGAFYNRYIVFQSQAQSHAVALWTAHTHLFQQFEQSPYLFVTSPEKRCGKSRSLDVAELIVARPWRVIVPSDAVLFRKIEAERPTVLLDEVDTIFHSKIGGNYEGLRALLNAGNRPGTAVPRCVGEGKSLVDFAVFSPKLLAGIGDLPDTLNDRSIVIRLARKTPNESVMPFRGREARGGAKPLKATLEAWASATNLAEARPEMPEGLDDRAEDNWEPLLAIADAAGRDWPEWARQAAVFLSGERDIEDPSVGVRLLTDCKAVFEEKAVDRLSTEELINSLIEIEEAPWPEYFGKPITPRGLAKLLKRYGISPGKHRFDEKTLKGYLASDFIDPWSRYCPVPLPEAKKGEQREHSSSEAKFEGERGDVEKGEKLPLTSDVPLFPFETQSKGNNNDYEGIFVGILRTIAAFWPQDGSTLKHLETINPPLFEWINDMEGRINKGWESGQVTQNEFGKLCSFYTSLHAKVAKEARAVQ